MSLKLIFVPAVLGICILFASACSGNKSNPQAASPTMRVVKMSGAIHLPVLLLQAGFSDSDLNQRPEALVVIAGGSDEPPQGPTGFELMGDGRYLVSDPVRKRVAVYDSSGAYQGEWRVGFPVESIAEDGKEVFRLHPSDSGGDRFFDGQGKERSAPESTQEVQPLSTRLAGPGLGILEGRKSGGPLNIPVDNNSLRLVSLQPLGSAANGAVYVALEVSPGGETLVIQKQVREYDAGGNVLTEVSDIPLNYDIFPADELKVRQGVLYQLAPYKSEIGINRWKLD